MAKEIKKISLAADSYEVVNNHPNKMLIRATVMKLNQMSDAVPGGDVVDRILLRSEEAEKGLDSFKGMGVNCLWEWVWSTEDAMTGHDQRFVVGSVTNAWVEGNELKADLVIYKLNFPDVAEFIKNAQDSLGFSVECAFTAKEGDGCTEVTDVEFLGVAILFKESAAYKTTKIDRLIASRRKENKRMNEQEKKEFLEQTVNTVLAAMKKDADEKAVAKAQAEKAAQQEEAFKSLAETVKTLSASVSGLVEKVEALSAEKEQAKETVEASEAKEDVPPVAPELGSKAKFEAGEAKPKTWGEQMIAMFGRKGGCK